MGGREGEGRVERVGGQEGEGVGGGGGWEAGGGFNLPLGLFGLAMDPRIASRRPKQTCLNGVRDVSPSLG